MKCQKWRMANWKNRLGAARTPRDARAFFQPLEHPLHSLFPLLPVKSFSCVSRSKNPGKGGFPTFCVLSRPKRSAFHNLLSSGMIQIKNHDDGRKPFPDFIFRRSRSRRLVASKPEGRRRKPWRRWIAPVQPSRTKSHRVKGQVAPLG